MPAPTTLLRRAVLVVAPALFALPLSAQSSQSSAAPRTPFFMSPGLQGFEARRQAGFGHFITDSVLRAASSIRLSHLIARHVPSIIFGIGASGGEYPVSSRVCGGGLACAAPKCYARVFFDGMLTFDGTPQMRDLEGIDFSHLRTEDLSGVEYYSSSAGVPSQYAGQNAECGTFLLWSRET